MKLITLVLFLTITILSRQKTNAQEIDLSAIELSIDQDYFADFLRDSSSIDRNYTVALRLGFYGALADHDYLGLPWVRKKIDGFLFDGLLENMGFRRESQSHNFVLTINGFSPAHISDEVPEFAAALAQGYALENDRPFSSFTGFRSSKRIEGNINFAHSASQQDLAITTSFTAGFASFGLAHSIENLFGGKRPSANLWSRDENKNYPTGQAMATLLPLVMYSISAEAVILRPMKKVVLQVRPELNLGYYTNIGVGLDLGKVMNVERHVDNLSYTDTNNPSLLAINDDSFGFSIVGGGTIRAVLYNAHLNGIFGLGKGHNFAMSETKKIVYEGYTGVKMQFVKKVELSFTINYRSSEFTSSIVRKPLWGTLGLKLLLDSPGEGCYD